MSAALEHLAEDLGASERTLRRALSRGMVRGTRVSPHKIELSVQERVYLRSHWPRLSGLQSALRTEPSVSLAVVFGSVARGDDDASSDVDLMVALRRSGVAQRLALAERLRARTGSIVEVLALEDALRRPALMIEIMRDGRVLVDREAAWPKLVAQGRRIGRDADRKRRLQAERARHAAAAFERKAAAVA